MFNHLGSFFFTTFWWPKKHCISPQYFWGYTLPHWSFFHCGFSPWGPLPCYPSTPLRPCCYIHSLLLPVQPTQHYVDGILSTMPYSSSIPPHGISHLRIVPHGCILCCCLRYYHIGSPCCVGIYWSHWSHWSHWLNWWWWGGGKATSEFGFGSPMLNLYAIFWYLFKSG